VGVGPGSGTLYAFNNNKRLKKHKSLGKAITGIVGDINKIFLSDKRNLTLYLVGRHWAYRAIGFRVRSINGTVSLKKNGYVAVTLPTSGFTRERCPLWSTSFDPDAGSGLIQSDVILEVTKPDIVLSLRFNLWKWWTDHYSLPKGKRAENHLCGASRNKTVEEYIVSSRYEVDFGIRKYKQYYGYGFILEESGFDGKYAWLEAA